MKIKRFFAKDMRQAIRNVREELGPDAVILSNRKLNGGIEIVSAIDYDESLFSNMSAASDKGRQESLSREQQNQNQNQVLDSDNSSEAIDTAAANTTAPAEWMEDPMLIHMKQELKYLRGVLENQLSQFSQSDLQRRDPERAATIHKLEQLGIDTDLSQEIASMLPAGLDTEQGWRQSLGLLSHQIHVTDDDILSRGGVVALVGPTGVGKTTSVAKLAARYSLRHGNRQVALISTDSYRIGAQEQLLNFGRILDVPTYAVNDASELSERLRDLADKRLVLIDTAGMSQRDIHLSEQLQTLNESSCQIRTYLVMASNTQSSTMQDVMRSFSKARPEGCILTKIDETTSLGGALSAIMRYQLPVAYLSDGQRVPEDMHPARAHSLVSRAVSMMQEQEMMLERHPNPTIINRKMANANV
jgi:flagellar biosynthesis protein FlhF